MKLMFISDIHGSKTALDKAMEKYALEKPDKLIILGDILYHGPRNPLPDGYDPKAVIEILNPLKGIIIAVRGNCDSEVDQMVLDFPMRSDYLELYIGNRHFYFSHGHLYDNNVPVVVEETGIYIQGHTHIPILKAIDGKTHMNPGSIALPKENHPPTYGVYEDGCLYIRLLDTKEEEKVNYLELGL